MISLRLLAPCALFSIVACTSSVSPQDSGRQDTGITGDAANPPVDASPDGASPMDAAAPADVMSPVDVTAPPNDVASPTDSGALFCTLPSGASCPAGTTCPAGDGCNRCECPETGGAPRCTRIACPPDAGATDAGATDAGVGSCSTAADCRLFESYCSTAPCACIALARSERDPGCDGRSVTCLVPPCQGRTADCVAGRCVVAGSM